jgi:hypothetical protein
MQYLLNIFIMDATLLYPLNLLGAEDFDKNRHLGTPLVFVSPIVEHLHPKCEGGRRPSLFEGRISAIYLPFSEHR